MSQEQRETQYRADVTQLNQERQKKKSSCPGSELAGDQRSLTRHTGGQPRKAFPFSDNLTTLMFIVASDLSEAQRERLTNSLSLQ